MYMHRFPEPTVSTLTRPGQFQVLVDSWEVECCARPPRLGRPSAWALLFLTSGNSRIDEIGREVDWHVVRFGDSDVALVNGAVTAYWPANNGPDPALGEARLRGYLRGTVHGVAVPDDFPRVSGIVRRIRVVSERWVRRDHEQGPPTSEPVPGTLTLTEVSTCPRWFAFPQPPPEDAPDNPLSQTGVLLDLTVDREVTVPDVRDSDGA